VDLVSNDTDTPPAVPPSAARRWLAQLAGPIAIVAACAQAAGAGWGRWGDFVIDTGRELEWPRRLLEGERLYADLRFYYGPLAPHLNALLYRLFGVRLEVLATAGAITGALTALAVYAVARRFTGRLPASLAALSFVYACAFQHVGATGIFNYVLPYTFAATYGMLAALVSLWTLLRYIASEGAAWFVASVAALALAALAKAEPLLPALAAHVLFVATTGAHGPRWLRHAVGYASAAAVVLVVYGHFYLQAGPALLRDNLGGALNPGAQHFIAAIMGLGAPALTLRALTVSALVLGGTACVAWATAGVLGASRLPRTGRWAACGVAAAAVLAPLSMLNPDRVFRPLPLLALGATCLWAWRWWRTPAARPAALAHAVLAAFSCAAAVRILFAATPSHYGFYMLAPAVAWLVVLFFEYLPGALGGSAAARTAFAICTAALLVGNASATQRVTGEALARKTLALRSRRGTLWVDPVQAGAIPILNVLTRSPRSTRVLILPHATAINFLTGRAGALDGMASYLPMEFSGGYDDAGVIARWERNPPDLVVWGRGPVAEFGDAEFGKTYAVEALRWLLAHYVPMGDPESQALLMRRRVGPAREPALPPAPAAKAP
jgi:4-amino-4-deoxy-L-arabinose transferase-like glycosyltransferase